VWDFCSYVHYCYHCVCK